MKTIKLQNFLKLHQKANAMVVHGANLCELISFNKMVTIDKYQLFLEKKNDEASSIHLRALMKSNGDVKSYLTYLRKQCTDVMLDFMEQDGFLVHKRLTIKDCHDTNILFEELSAEVKSKISLFISLQKSSLKCFLSKLDNSENLMYKSKFIWNASITALIELAVALYESNAVKAENGSLTKKEFIKEFANFFSINPGSWEITLNKAMSRENPAKFIDELKATLLEYNNSLLNI